MDYVMRIICLVKNWKLKANLKGMRIVKVSSTLEKFFEYNSNTY